MWKKCAVFIWKNIKWNFCANCVNLHAFVDYKTSPVRIFREERTESNNHVINVHFIFFIIHSMLLSRAYFQDGVIKQTTVKEGNVDTHANSRLTIGWTQYFLSRLFFRKRNRRAQIHAVSSKSISQLYWKSPMYGRFLIARVRSKQFEGSTSNNRYFNRPSKKSTVCASPNE